VSTSNTTTISWQNSFLDINTIEYLENNMPAQSVWDRFTLLPCMASNFTWNRHRRDIYLFWKTGNINKIASAKQRTGCQHDL